MKHIKHMSKQEKFNLMIWLGILAAVLIGSFWYAGLLPQGIYEIPGVVPYTQNNQQAKTPPPTVVDQKTAIALTYEAAMAKYKDRRLQFGFYQNSQSCVMTPNRVVYKNGTDIMLDNRTNTSLKVSLDNVPHVISPYGFVIVKASTTASLPHNMSVDCGTGYNNGTIILQQ